MKIDKIKKLSGGKYAITMDNKEKIVTYEEVILNHNLLFSKEVNEELLDKLNIDTNYFELYHKTLKYISTRLRSKLEVLKYLDKLGASSKDKKSLIEQFEKNGVINDINYLKAYIYDKINLSNDGPNKIKKELEKQNVDVKLVEEELKKYEDIMFERLNHLVFKKIKTIKASKYMLKNKIMAYFINLGYDSYMISECLENNLKYASNNIQKDYDKIYNQLCKKYEDSVLEYKITTKLYQKGYTKDEIDTIKKAD